MLLLMTVILGYDHGMKIQQTLGSAKAAAQSNDHDLALKKIDEMLTQIEAWKKDLQEAKLAPAQPEVVPQPPAESVPFSINSTHIPSKCPRKSVEGATMKVHYV